MEINSLLEKIQEVRTTDPVKLYKMSCENLYSSAVSLVALITGLSLQEAEIKFARALLDADSLDIVDDGEVVELVSMYRELIGMSHSKNINNMLLINAYTFMLHATDFETKFSQVVRSGYAKMYGYLHIYLFCKLGVFTALSTVDYDNINPDMLNQERVCLSAQLN